MHNCEEIEKKTYLHKYLKKADCEEFNRVPEFTGNRQTKENDNIQYK